MIIMAWLQTVVRRHYIHQSLSLMFALAFQHDSGFLIGDWLHRPVPCPHCGKLWSVLWLRICKILYAAENDCLNKKFSLFSLFFSSQSSIQIRHCMQIESYIFLQNHTHAYFTFFFINKVHMHIFYVLYDKTVFFFILLTVSLYCVILILCKFSVKCLEGRFINTMYYY